MHRGVALCLSFNIQGALEMLRNKCLLSHWKKVSNQTTQQKTRQGQYIIKFSEKCNKLDKISSNQQEFTGIQYIPYHWHLRLWASEYI